MWVYFQMYSVWLCYVEKFKYPKQISTGISRDSKKLDWDIPNSRMATLRKTKDLDSRYFAGLSSPE